MRRHAGRRRLARFRCVLLVLTLVLLLAAAVSDGIRLPPAAGGEQERRGQQETMSIAPSSQVVTNNGIGNGGGGLPPTPPLVLQVEEEEVRATGSSLPDCTHACGACSPCIRVMVTFKCSAAEPLPCPMVYRCMCRGKCYPVPSS